ncbi:cysteine desulfurase [Erysipelothrix sp. HDW6C]|uniref:cysteine desulfurase family protein n=1 Tax=Erysipelothrix sp. HDW6C TaxID=2714930 RepID=UPI00140D58BD|nr:cysteine desulfurase family protein [Erysipelothrix sp. HDW6C]QIK70925.1 cysteine desulfurase [Erysipelothrix sp. HDW6C]
MPKVPDKIYLDYASTTPTRPEILQDAQKVMAEYYENADSLHFGGQRVSDLVTQSRNALAKMLGVLPHEIYFTSGASEANSTIIKGIAFANQHLGKHIITTQIEHSSVMGATAQLRDYHGFEIDYLSVDHNGNINLDELKHKLRKDTILVTLMAVNNEVGAITDVNAVARLVKKESNAFVHIDGVQALARHDFEMTQIDAVSYSAHKIYGLKGSGLLVKKAAVPCLSLINGGQQQFGLRGGTLDNVAAILWAKTLRLARDDHKRSFNDIIRMQKYLHESFSQEEGIEFNSTLSGTPYIFNISVLNVGSEIMMNGLNAQGIAVSAQSTCNSKSLEPSHVLKAMGRSDQAALTSVRISLSHLTTMDELETVVKQILEIKKYVNH